jgi:two-component system NarL family sensor kinase
MRRLQRIVLTCLTLLLCVQGISQGGYTRNTFVHRKDSLVAILQNYPAADTARAKALFAIVDCAAFLKEKKEVLPYWQQAMDISIKLKFAKTIAACLVWMGSYYKSAQKIDSALIYLDSGINVAINAHDQQLKHTVGFANYFRGMIYENQENLYAALQSYFGAIKYYDGSLPDIQKVLFGRIASIYKKLDNTDKAIEFYKLSEEYTVVADLYFEKKDVANAKLFLNMIAPHMPDTVETEVTGDYFRLRGNIARREHKPDSAILFLQQALPYYKNHQFTHANFLTDVLTDLASLQIEIGNMNAAKIYADESMVSAKEDGRKQTISAALKSMAAYDSKTGNYAAAYKELLESTVLGDSVVFESNIKQANTLAAIYQNQKKEEQIAELRSDKEIEAAKLKQKSLLNTIFIVAFVAIFITAFLLYRNFRHVQKLNKQESWIHHQKINQLENEKHLLAVEAMLKGQEEERTRLAKDLHDGLGGMLSGVKISFSNMKDNIIMDHEHMVAFEKSIAQLDNTIDELRKVSHNLMPEALVKFGLKSAVKDFCDSVQDANTRIICEQLGVERELGNKGDVNVYRIIQELVSNAVKHARASQVLVQLTKTPQKVMVTVEDNGKGLDQQQLATSNGIGLTNIKHRVNYLNGTMDVSSNPGDGTTINIELSV